MKNSTFQARETTRQQLVEEFRTSVKKLLTTFVFKTVVLCGVAFVAHFFGYGVALAVLSVMFLFFT